MHGISFHSNSANSQRTNPRIPGDTRNNKNLFQACVIVQCAIVHGHKAGTHLFIALIDEYFVAIFFEIVRQHIPEYVRVTDAKCLHEHVLHVGALVIEHFFQTVVHRGIPVEQIGKRSFDAHQFTIDDHWKVHSQNDIVVDCQPENDSN